MISTIIYISAWVISVVAYIIVCIISVLIVIDINRKGKVK